MEREVTRLIVYRGNEEAMAAQLGKSLPDGSRSLREGALTVTVRTLDDSLGLLLGSADPIRPLLGRISSLEASLHEARLELRDLKNAQGR
jgi:hypothetical protein